MDQKTVIDMIVVDVEMKLQTNVYVKLAHFFFPLFKSMPICLASLFWGTPVSLDYSLRN